MATVEEMANRQGDAIVTGFNFGIGTGWDAQNLPLRWYVHVYRYEPRRRIVFAAYGLASQEAAVELAHTQGYYATLPPIREREAN